MRTIQNTSTQSLFSGKRSLSLFLAQKAWQLGKEAIQRDSVSLQGSKGSVKESSWLARRGLELASRGSVLAWQLPYRYMQGMSKCQMCACWGSQLNVKFIYLLISEIHLRKIVKSSKLTSAYQWIWAYKRNVPNNVWVQYYFICKGH